MKTLLPAIFAGKMFQHRYPAAHLDAMLPNFREQLLITLAASWWLDTSPLIVAAALLALQYGLAHLQQPADESPREADSGTNDPPRSLVA